MWAVVALILILIYLLPSFIAVASKKREALAVILLNVLFGWTILGWIVTLVWALMLCAEKDPLVEPSRDIKVVITKREEE